ncbi:PH domain-containing protein [Nicoliella spurrieriana]|uniref:PH domain-containing protein n=1 Tax=Nicoliella spurrieriana TaxID=2925830 RepID=A0A976RT88_9LACO|nr:PH domain-containing protein [Nicoliella spurrieriana]UQS87216.1 PH domain-containing protein [Nicoliella spurrieriana]
MRNKHQHPLALVSMFFESFKFLFYLLLAVAFLKLELLIEIGIFLLGLFIVLDILRYAMFTYSILPNELVIKEGVIFRKEHHIPYERIQTIQNRQWFYLRPFGIEELVINNAGTSHDDSEISLHAVSTKIAPILEQHHEAATNSGQPKTAMKQSPAIENESKASNNDQYRIKGTDMFIFGLTNLRVMAEVLVIISFLDRLHVNFDSFFSIFANLANSIYLIVSSIISAVILLAVASMVETLVRYYGFTLTKQGEHLVIEKGLFQTKRINVPINKIQAVEFKQNALRQLFHLVTIRIHLITGVSSDDDKEVVTVMPVINEQLAYKMINRFIGMVPVEPIQFTAGDNRSKWLFSRNNLLWTVILGAAISTFFRPWWLYAILIVIAAINICMGIYRGKQTAVRQINASQLALRTTKMFTRTVDIVNWHQIQSMTVNQSLFMTHSKRAHLQLAVRSGFSATNMTCRYLPQATVEPIFNWYHHFNL